MATPIPLRDDFNGLGLRRLAREATDANQARRLLALAAIYDLGSRTDAASGRARYEALSVVMAHFSRGMRIGNGYPFLTQSRAMATYPMPINLFTDYLRGTVYRLTGDTP